jgi:hypothetical protein
MTSAAADPDAAGLEDVSLAAAGAHAVAKATSVTETAVVSPARPRRDP